MPQSATRFLSVASYPYCKKKKKRVKHLTENTIMDSKTRSQTQILERADDLIWEQELFTFSVNYVFRTVFVYQESPGQRSHQSPPCRLDMHGLKTDPVCSRASAAADECCYCAAVCVCVCMCVKEPDTQWPHCLEKRVTLLWASSPTLDFIKGLLSISEQINTNYDIIYLSSLDSLSTRRGIL